MPLLIIAATGSNALAPQTYGVGEAYFPRNFKNAINDQFNFTMETSFGTKAQWLFSTGYVGSRRKSSLHPQPRVRKYSIHLCERSGDACKHGGRPGSTATAATQPQTAQVPNPYQPASGSLLPFQNQLAGATIQQFIPYLPYPLLYAAAPDRMDRWASAATIPCRRTSRIRRSALYLDVNYTWSKNLGFVQQHRRRRQYLRP